MAKRIYATEEEIAEFLRTTQEQLIAQCRKMQSKKIHDNTTNGLTVNFKLKEKKDDRKATIMFAEKAWMKIYALIYSYSTEVEWHGVVERLATDTFLIKDILVFPHEVTSATVISDQKTYEKWLDTLDDDTFNSLRFHGHSHVNMSVTPSEVDKTYRRNKINEFGAPSDTSDFFYIFLIFNKKGEVSGEVYDLQNNALYSTNELIIEFVDGDCDWLRDFLAEAKKVVKERSYSSSTDSTYYGTSKYKPRANRQSRKADDDEEECEEYYGGLYGYNDY